MQHGGFFSRSYAARWSQQPTCIMQILIPNPCTPFPIEVKMGYKRV